MRNQRSSRRPTESEARKAIEAWLEEHTPGYPTYSLTKDGDDGWAFWIEEEDTTSYVHADLSIEWYGTGWTKDPGEENGENGGGLSELAPTGEAA